MEPQFIGVDIGRGYVKGYTNYNGNPKECLFKSVIGEFDSAIELDKYDNPIAVEIGGKEWAAGLLAEKESNNQLVNQSDDKTSLTAKVLIYTLLSKLSESDTVRLCIGVPNKTFKKSTLKEVEDTYAGKSITVKNLINNTSKTILIEKVTIYRESDAALYYAVMTSSNRTELENKAVGMVTIGFRTTELSYFDKMKFNNKLSDTLEKGNRSVLEVIQSNLKKKDVTKPLNEIDSDSSYNDMKEIETEILVERINQDIEMKWVNYPEMTIFLAGGTTLNFKNIPKKFVQVDDPQMITAKGLCKIAEMGLR